MTIEENLKFKEEVIKRQFKYHVGYELNLDNPKTFNEKIQWLKLYYHDPIMTKCADKYLVREYIKEKIGEEYLIPLLGVWDKVDDIDFDSLPNQFVLKVNWGCGQNIIVKDKSKLNIEEAKNKLKNWLNPFSNHYYWSYEWQYKNIEPKIICEKYLEQIDEQIYDYKFFCFNGIPKYIQVDIDRFSNHKRCIYDTNWNKLEFTNNYPLYNKDIEKPKKLSDMLKISKILSKSFKFIRVDFYIINNMPIFGELTFTHENGFGKFIPIDWDYKFGKLLELPKEKKIEYDWIDRQALITQCNILEPISYKYREMKNIIKRLNNLNEELKLKSNLFTLFGMNNNRQYLQIILFGIKLTFKKNKNR